MKKILQPGQNCQGIFDVEETGLLIDGRDYYRAFYSAARMASRYILIAGWQFDTDVLLLRGEDAREAEGDKGLLLFLNGLCEKTPSLNIYVLAWDFSVLFALEREWFQDWTIRWTSNERIHFRFDSQHPFGASHHQKLAIIDGQIAFVGGLDICSSRWDDRCHTSENPDRIDSDGKMYGPYHDIQSYHVGPAAFELTKLFQARWVDSGGEALDLGNPIERVRFPVIPSVAISSDRIAISQTRARTLIPLRDAVLEIRSLYLDAIRSAEELIYIENQYFSSQAVYQALKERMRAKDGSKLQMVMILPQRPEGFLEEVSMYLPQAKMLYSLREIASRTGHTLEIYYTTSKGEEKQPTYIHAKLLLVDDRFLTVGSANTTNRSMGLDTELNVSWEAHAPDQRGLIQSIRRARISLLAEHGGLRGARKLRGLAEKRTVVDDLHAEADRPSGRLHRHPVETFFDNREWLKEFDLEALSLDPEKALVEENVFELISKDRSGLFADGIVVLNEWLSGKSEGRVTPVSERPLRLKPAFKKVLFPVLRLLSRSRAVKWTLLGLFGLILAFLLWAAFQLL